MAIAYTTIQHGFRKTNNLSCNEYILCDMVNMLSSNSEKSNVPGWCYISRENLASEIGVSKQTVLNIIDRMIEKGFVIRNEQTKYLKTSSSWQRVYFTDGKETLPDNLNFGKETVPNDGKETLPYNNKLDNNKEKEKETVLPSEKLKIKKDKFYADLRSYQKDHPDKYPAGLYKKFIVYWTEESKDQKKIRLDKEDFFNIGKRLGTFWSFTKPDEKNELWKEHNEAKSKTQPKLL